MELGNLKTIATNKKETKPILIKRHICKTIRKNLKLIIFLLFYLELVCYYLFEKFKLIVYITLEIGVLFKDYKYFAS